MRTLLRLLFCIISNLQAQTPQDPLRSGLLALQRNDLQAARASQQMAAMQQPSNARVWVALSQTFWKSNELGMAKDAAQKAWSFAAADLMVWQSLVIYYSESHQTLRAAQAQERLAGLTPSKTAAQEHAIGLYFEAVQPLLAALKFGEAVALLNAASAAITKNAQIQIALGVAYYGLRRYDESPTAFLNVIALDPALKQPYLFLDKMLDQIPSRLEEITRLFVVFQKQHSLDPDAFLLHAKVLSAPGVEPDTACKLLEKTIAMVPNNADAHFELGSVLERKQQFQAATREFERAEALNPSDPTTHYRLSRLYERLNKPEAATTEREQHRKTVTALNAAR